MGARDELKLPPVERSFEDAEEQEGRDSAVLREVVVEGDRAKDRVLDSRRTKVLLDRPLALEVRDVRRAFGSVDARKDEVVELGLFRSVDESLALILFTLCSSWSSGERDEEGGRDARGALTRESLSCRNPLTSSTPFSRRAFEAGESVERVKALHKEPSVGAARAKFSERTNRMVRLLLALLASRASMAAPPCFPVPPTMRTVRDIVRGMSELEEGKRRSPRRCTEAASSSSSLSSSAPTPTPTASSKIATHARTPSTHSLLNASPFTHVSHCSSGWRWEESLTRERSAFW